MATSTAQRTGIWIIAIVLTIGTLAGFVAMILAPQNEASEDASLQKAYADYQRAAADVKAKQDAQQAELDKEAETLSTQYFTDFSSYGSRVTVFDAAQAQEKLVTEDLKIGDGDTIGDETTYAVYYIGWLPDGTIFDGSIDGQKLKTPFIARPSGTIAGWGEGVKGMKINGVRQLTIPSDKGYGEGGSGAIPANTPLKFILMPFRTLETIKEPTIPKELLNVG